MTSNWGGRLSRRGLIGGMAAVGAAAAVPSAPVTAAPAASPGATAAASTEPTAVVVGPDDHRYGDLVRGTNARWVGQPERVVLARTTAQVVAAVQAAVDAGKRISVRSGGHCYEGFVSNPEVKVIVDLSEMNRVDYDPGRRAFVIEPGAMLSEVYERLYKFWGVTIPGGSCPSVGAGGHIVGGGYGALSRLFGLTVDHLYGVEVVTVDRAGTARAVVATREPGDPNRELWWAHTGGGGGNFGIVTRYWLRSPNATGSDPAGLLPRPPAEVVLVNASWSWSSLTEETFARLVTNFGRWHERNSAPGSPATRLFSQLKLFHRSGGNVVLVAQVDAGAASLLSPFLAEIDAGVGGMTVTERRQVNWLHATGWPGFAGIDPTLRFKDKSAYLRRSFTPTQVAAIHRHLTDGYRNGAALLLLAGYGGQVNAVASDATAVPQRDSILKAQYLNFWSDPAEDEQHLSWVRDFYRDVYAETGGVPAPNQVNDGCFVNYADVDLGDRTLNRSGTPWHALYYKGGYPRLQRAKARWDPTNVFRHAQSIQLP
ncbi:FAD-binding protein [Micromonospora sp. WMMD882]|uniref:FAD-binding oxidoreductase n=1 Tax=Micromonospora sp. WMMD882 TaxID=3015151 RepID=UPI00248BDCC5|nr:FAD-binding protein [Micromonospora sp. WMMD882]WBB80518.1 FAD-binding protein [Micromonospora sp. WMMD882]